MSKLFRQTPKSFLSASGVDEKHNYLFSPKALSCLKMPYSKGTMLFWQHCHKIFLEAVREVLSQSLKMTKKFLLLRKEKFIPKCSSQVMKRGFDNTSGNFSLKKLQQTKNLSILSQKNSQNCTSGHVEWSFDNNAKKFLPESIEFPPKVQKRWTEKKIKINPLPLKTQLVFVLRRKKLAKFIFVLREQSFFEVLPLTHSDHNKLPFRSLFFAKNLEIFCSMSDNSRNNKYFFKKLVFAQNVTIVAPNATLEIWQEIFPKKGSKSVIEKPELTKSFCCFQRKKSFQMFFWTFIMQFTQCCGKTLVKVMKKMDQNP